MVPIGISTISLTLLTRDFLKEQKKVNENWISFLRENVLDEAKIMISSWGVYVRTNRKREEIIWGTGINVCEAFDLEGGIVYEAT